MSLSKKALRFGMALGLVALAPAFAALRDSADFNPQLIAEMPQRSDLLISRITNAQSQVYRYMATPGLVRATPVLQTIYNNRYNTFIETLNFNIDKLQTLNDLV